MKAIAPLLAILALCAGCIASNVPRSGFSGSICGQPFNVASPKDYELHGLRIEVRSLDVFGGTNYGMITVDSVKASMNPEIVTTTADGMVKMIQAGSAAFGSAAGAALK